VRYGKSYYRQLIGNHTLAFDWCHFWWPWSTFEGHFSLGCHFHFNFSYPWHAFAPHGLPAIAELLVSSASAPQCHCVCQGIISLLHTKSSSSFALCVIVTIWHSSRLKTQSLSLLPPRTGFIISHSQTSPNSLVYHNFLLKFLKVICRQFLDLFIEYRLSCLYSISRLILYRTDKFMTEHLRCTVRQSDKWIKAYPTKQTLFTVLKHTER